MNAPPRWELFDQEGEQKCATFHPVPALAPSCLPRPPMSTLRLCFIVRTPINQFRLILSLLNRSFAHTAPFELSSLEFISTRVQFIADSKIPHAGTFTIMREDHTLGNLLRMQLLRDPRVLFAGYRVPHPLEHVIEVKVQTTEDIDPQQAMIKAMECLMNELNNIDRSFRDEIQKSTQSAHRQGRY